MSAITIRVQNPMTHVTAEGRFTSYLIFIETDNLAFSLKKSNIRRRYSEFVWFRDILARNHPDITPPSLPKKTFFRDRFDTNLIEDRKLGLENFLHTVVSETRYLSDNTVHLFLQSPLSTNEIDAHQQNPRSQSVSSIITAHEEEARGVCPDCNGSLYASEEDGVTAASPPDSLPGVGRTAAQPCPHDIFSPTRPHSFDFSHCVIGHSRSYDSSDEVIVSKELEQVQASK